MLEEKERKKSFKTKKILNIVQQNIQNNLHIYTICFPVALL